MATISYLPTAAASMNTETAEARPESSAEFTELHRDAMITKHLPLVRYVAGSMARHSNASSIVDYDDLVGYGVEGLIEAVDTFNPTYNVRFSTWAVMHIRTTIQDALRTLDPLPRSLRSKGKEIDRVSWPSSTCPYRSCAPPCAISTRPWYRWKTSTSPTAKRAAIRGCRPWPTRIRTVTRKPPSTPSRRTSSCSTPSMPCPSVSRWSSACTTSRARACAPSPKPSASPSPASPSSTPAPSSCCAKPSTRPSTTCPATSRNRSDLR
ncbi:MAG: sigma-70 family RNA polymerase sigma factor [Chloroflexi bacterium]|nr:sigma-70 family RNA polymerase sigma factor [Chloroflexota bacterium]